MKYIPFPKSENIVFSVYGVTLPYSKSFSPYKPPPGAYLHPHFTKEPANQWVLSFSAKEQNQHLGHAFWPLDHCSTVPPMAPTRAGGGLGPSQYGSPLLAAPEAPQQTRSPSLKSPKMLLYAVQTKTW